MPSTSLAYRMLVRAGETLAPVGGLVNDKIARGVAGRRGLGARVQAWGAAGRDRSRPLAWFHASSVGEGLQARAVLRAFRARHPDWQVAYTHFSPSATEFAASIRADFTDYLALDTAHAARAAIDALTPSLLVFAKLDVWPELATQAAARSIPVALVAGTVRPGSGRLRPLARRLLTPGYRALDAVGAVSAADGERLKLLGVSAPRLRVTGDPRVDSILDRVDAVPADEPLLALRDGRTLVAGSTWREDEAVVLAAFAAVRVRRPEARLILVPHEPDAIALEQITRMVGRLGLPAAMHLDRPRASPLVVVDRMGVLATLYGAGMAAYVGGGFGRAGLHSVLEPAAWQLPVLFGSRWQDNRDAAALVASGGGVPVANAEALASAWFRWLDDEVACATAGARAGEVVQRERGAASRSALMLEELLA